MTATVRRSRSSWSVYATVAVLAALLAAVAVFVPSKMLLWGLVFLVLGAVFSRVRGDAVLVLLLVLASMALIPANLTVSALGSVGTPAILLGLFAGLVWLVQWLAPHEVARQRYRPVPLLLVAFLAAILASYAASAMRAKDGLESTAADRGLLMLVAGVGLALLTAEAVSSRERLDTLIKGMVLAGCAIAAVGVLQFWTGFDLASQIRVPGLSPVVDGATFIAERSSFRRVAGMTAHPIEFSVVMCMLLPLALHLALQHSKKWFYAAALLGLALPMSVSRTAVLGLVAMMIVLVPSWPRQLRHRFYLGAVGYLVVLRLLLPGLLGTIKALFVDAGTDPSINSREVDYAYVGTIFAERPLFGRGFATFIPTRYDFLDNQYLLGLVETGIVGVIAYVALIGGTAIVAELYRSRSSNEVDRSLAQALVATLVVVLATSFAFDFMGFATVRMLMFIAIGCVGALWRLGPSNDASTDTSSSDVAGASAGVEGER